MPGPSETIERSRSEKLERIVALGIDPWGSRFDNHQAIESVRALPPEAEPPTRVRIAGRIVQRRGMGKVYFVDLKDWTGRIQVYLGQKQIGEQGWALAQELDLGDLLGIDGHLGKTRTGELTVFADGVHFLGKSLLPHPDKWSGMQEMEYRLRHRYLDLVYNPETLERARQRILIVRTIRQFLDAQGFSEVETPTPHAIAGGYRQAFTMHHNTSISILRIALSCISAAARGRMGAGAEIAAYFAMGSARGTIPNSRCSNSIRHMATTRA